MARQQVRDRARQAAASTEQILSLAEKPDYSKSRTVTEELLSVLRERERERERERDQAPTLKSSVTEELRLSLCIVRRMNIYKSVN